MSDPDPDDPDFEEVVAALLKIDPEGIVGQTAGKDKKADEDDASGDRPDDH